MTAFINAVFITVAMTGGMYLWAKRRPVGAQLSWGEAFLGGLFVFAWFIVIYGLLPNAWLQWCDGPLKWRSDKIGIPLGPLHYWRIGGGKHPLMTLRLLQNHRKYLGFIPVAKGLAWPNGITFFGYGKLNFNAQDMRDVVAALIYGVMIGVQVKAWLWWQARGKAAAATRELPTSAYGRPLVRKA